MGSHLQITTTLNIARSPDTFRASRMGFYRHKWFCKDRAQWNEMQTLSIWKPEIMEFVGQFLGQFLGMTF